MAKKTTAPNPEVPVVSEQPYYLQRAHIKDFRSIRDAKVEFKPGLNIIIGANGSGKTNFLEGITNALSESTHNFSGDVKLVIQGRNELRVGAKRKIIQHEEFFRATGLIPESNRKEIVLSSVKLHIKADSFLTAQYELFKIRKPVKQNFSSLKLITLPYGIPSGYSIIKEPVTFHANADGGSYSMHGDSQFANSLASSVSSALRNAYKSVEDDDVIPDIKDVSVAVDFIEEFYRQEYLPSIKKATSITDIRFAGRLDPYVDATKQYLTVNAVRLEFKIGDDWLPFDALSSGTQRMFYIVTEVIASYLYFSVQRKEIKVLSDGPDIIIIIEEPELGVHPDQLHKLLLFLREQSEKHQLIITTHSPQVLDMLKEDELDRITICELDEKKGTHFRKLKKAQIATAKKYMKEVGFLSDYWRYGSLETSN